MPVLSPQQMWNIQHRLIPLASGQPLLNLANIKAHLKEMMFPHSEEHLFQKRVFERDFSFLVFATLAFSPAKWWTHWWFTQGPARWSHSLGPYEQDSVMWVKFSCVLHSASATLQSSVFHSRVYKWSVSGTHAFCWFSNLGIQLPFVKKEKDTFVKVTRLKLCPEMLLCKWHPLFYWGSPAINKRRI